MVGSLSSLDPPPRKGGRTLFRNVIPSVRVILFMLNRWVWKARNETDSGYLGV